MSRTLTPVHTSSGAIRAVYALALGRTVDRLVEAGLSLKDIADLFNEQAVMGFNRKPVTWYPTSMTRIYRKHCGVPALLGDMAVAEWDGYPCVHPALGNHLSASVA